MNIENIIDVTTKVLEVIACAILVAMPFMYIYFEYKHKIFCKRWDEFENLSQIVLAKIKRYDNGETPMSTRTRYAYALYFGMSDKFDGNKKNPITLEFFFPNNELSFLD